MSDLNPKNCEWTVPAGRQEEWMTDNLFELKEQLRILSSPDECPYLPDRTSLMEFRFFSSMRGETFQELLRRGWRKQGVAIFRPTCRNCQECRSIRIDVDEFKPTKSQRRAMKKNQDIRLVVQSPTLTEDHLRLFEDYHQYMSEHRGWPHKITSASQYEDSFMVGNFEFTKEFLYYREDELVGVGIVDVLPDSLSSVYFYHDPDWRNLAPGTFTIQREIQYARETGRRHLYLGYWVEDCPSMTYKARFGPHQLLQGYPGDSEEPEWRSVNR